MFRILNYNVINQRLIYPFYNVFRSKPPTCPDSRTGLDPGLPPSVKFNYRFLFLLSIEVEPEVIEIDELP